MTVMSSIAHDGHLATLISLGRRARDAESIEELRFLLVNETANLLSFHQAVFWSVKSGVLALSGVGMLDPTSPYVRWLEGWFKCTPKADKTLAFASDMTLLQSGSKEWQEWLPSQVVVVNIPAMGRFEGGQLLLARDTSFSRPELALLQEWCEIWRGEYRHFVKPSLRERLLPRPSQSAFVRWSIRSVLILSMIAISQIPVNLSVLAPSDLVPKDPSVVRSPMDGIIERVLVEPNQRVEQGDPLFEFDRVSLENQLEMARRALITRETEYRQRAQRALFDLESKSQLSVVQSQIDESRLEVQYLEALNARATVRAIRAGIVLLNDPSEWSGRPVATGERLLVITSERDVELEAWLAPEDIVSLPEQAKVTLFLASDPTQPIAAELRYLAHQPEARPDGNFAYRARAVIKDSSEKVRVGLKGTARIDAASVPLIYWIGRRPWASLRGWLGV